LKNILSQTKNLLLRLDANKKFNLNDYKTLLEGIDLSFIDYVEDPTLKSSELVDLFNQVRINIALDEDLHLLRDVQFSGIKSAIIKPTAIGDYHTIKKIYNDCNKRGISLVFSSSF